MTTMLIAKIILLLIFIIFIIFYKEKFVGGYDGPTFVFFSADWCGYCKEFQPVWDDIIVTSSVKIKFTQIPHTESEKYSIEAYPTLRYYPNGLQKDYVEYTGARNKKSIEEFLEQI